MKRTRKFLAIVVMVVMVVSMVMSTVTFAESTTTEEKTEAMYTCDSEDALYYTFDDGVEYKIHIETDFLDVERIENGDVTEQVISFGGENRKCFDRFIEKYFYFARATNEKLPTREVTEPVVEIDESEMIFFEAVFFFFSFCNGACSYLFCKNCESWEFS